MQQMRLASGPEAHLALDAQRAGLALACAFSSSDEFEAEVIRARREAGAFGPAKGRRHKSVYWGCALGALILLLIVSL
jgi:hypothetical protein